MISSTLFFIRESKGYIGQFTWKDYLYYPVAYIRFMYFEWKHR